MNVSASATKVDREHSWTGNTKDWALSRYGAALAAVHAHGEETDLAKEIAVSLLTHWSIETGAGAGEFNYNVGNINVGSGAQNIKYFTVTDVDGTTHAERAFDSLTDGVEAYIALLNSSRYAAAAKKLADEPDQADWFVTLGKSGWFDPTKAKPASTWEAAAAAYAARRALLAQTVFGQ